MTDDNKLEGPWRIFEDQLLRAVNDALWRDLWRSLRSRPITEIVNPELQRSQSDAETSGEVK